MSNKTNYFITFSVDGNRFGNVEIRRDTPISSMKDVRDLEDTIKTKENVGSVLIIQWQIFEGNISND